jgi:NAD-dependent dihydropyrimidine dehydrogenase PreA subunit
MAIERIDQGKCVGCMQCFETCYAGVILMDKDTNKPVAKYPQDCAVCCWCVALCPAKAIVFTPVKTSPVFTSWG